MLVHPTKAVFDDRLNNAHGKGSRIVRKIASYYHKWAYFISRNIFLIILISSVISAIGALKVVLTPFKNDITGYTPLGSRSLAELKTFQRFFDANGSANTAMFLLMIPKDGGNMLREETLNEVVRVEKILTTKFTMPNYNTGKNESYREFCRSFCWVNEPIIQWINGFTVQKHHLLDGEEDNERIDLHYPRSTLFGRRFNIQPYFFGVHLRNGTNVGHDAQSLLIGDANTTEMSADKGGGVATYSNMKEAKMLALTLRGEAGEGWTEEDVTKYEYGIYNYFAHDFTSPHIRVLTISATVVEQEIIRTGTSILPYVLIGFCIMITVSTFFTFLSSSYYRQFSFYKMTLAFFACVCPFMATATGLALMFAVGFRFASILCVTPFLVLAIGLDDAYLMLHSWHRVTRERRHNYPVENDSPHDRLAEVLMDTGPAILISALTNILADLVGTYTGAPEITLLAYANMICIAIDFVYQITFYSAIMILVGAVEMNHEEAQRTGKVPSDPDELIIPCLPWFTTPICFFYTGFGHFESINQEHKWHDWVKENFIVKFMDKYISLLMNKIFAVGVMIFWIVGLSFCIWGITGMEVNLTPTKLFAEDSPLQEMGKLRDDYIIPYFFLATVLVSNPGNLSDPIRLKKLEGMVAELEGLPYAWGPASTNFFLRDFKEYSGAVEDSEDSSEIESSGGLDMNRLPEFVSWPEYKHWNGIVKFSKGENGKSMLDRFLFTTAYRGDDLRHWPKRNVLLKMARSTLLKYEHVFNATLFMDDALFLDVIENMPEDMWQAGAATLVAMALICLVFLQDFFTTFVATCSIASTMAGILGILAWARTDLDPIVMAALIISMGFSVDIPAHVTYHYHTADVDCNRERIRASLASVGIPALQASMSTSICVMSLLTSNVYMSHVFVKTMSLCVILCLINGLIVIPTTLNLLEPIMYIFRKKRPDSSISTPSTIPAIEAETRLPPA